MNNNENKNGIMEAKELESRILASKGHALFDREIIGLFLRAIHNETHARMAAKEIIGDLNSIARSLSIDPSGLCCWIKQYNTGS